MRFTVYMNTDEHNFRGYEPGAALATDDDLTFDVVDLSHAYAVGNRMAPDLDDREWPNDVRSVSVGDVLKTETGWAAVASFGFDPISEPTNIVPLAGQERVTAR